MDLRLDFLFSRTDIINEINDLKKQVDALRPLPTDVEGKIMQKLRLEWNYNSNAIEGNKLNYGETVAFLMEGITAKGKPLKDHLDIRGHNEAINYLLEMVKNPRVMTEADIRSLHEMILVEPYDSPAKTADGLPTTKRINLGQYKTSANHVKTSTGEIHYYATPEETPIKMKELMDWYAEVEYHLDIHPAVVAAQFHHKFVEIHPFDDGNGRLSRILMNLILMRFGYPPVVIKMDDRRNYYSLLSRADAGDSWPFVEYISELEKASLQLYLKAAKGGDIDDEDDIDKEIALFKIQLQSKVISEDIKSEIKIAHIIRNDLFNLFKELVLKSNAFDEYFSKTNKLFHVDFINNEMETGYENFFSGDNFQILNNIVNILSISGGFFLFAFDAFRDHIGINIKIYWNIMFSENEYHIYHLNQKEVISKTYNESITKTEQKMIIKVFIEEVKREIEKLIK